VNAIDNDVTDRVAVLVKNLGGPGEPVLGGEVLVAAVGHCQNPDRVLTVWLFRGLFCP
jgi:hypothetical protein